MRSIAIATIVDQENYGNRLQNYALQEAVREAGSFDVSTLHSRQGFLVGVNPVRRKFLSLLVKGPRAVLRERLGMQTFDDRAFLADRAALSSFTEHYISQARVESSSSPPVPPMESPFSHVIVGSDQVWHPHYGLPYDLGFLRLVTPERRIAYAASFGTPSIPWALASRYRKGLSGITQLSVREERGAEMVRQLTGRRAPVVLDPTMLFDDRWWGDRAELPAPLAGKGYLLELHLGKGVAERPDALEDYARTTGLEIVALGLPSGSGLSAMSPLEFIGAIRGAKFVVTDSFHAAVFCVQFRVPFLIRTRGDMGFRFDTLAKKAGMTLPALGRMSPQRAAGETDWDAIHARLAQERVISRRFLAEALT